MKYNIIKFELNVDRLNAKIIQKNPQYLIMNSETCDMLYEKTKENISLPPLSNKITSIFSTYRGIPIAICNELKYGEVDII